VKARIWRELRRGVRHDSKPKSRSRRHRHQPARRAAGAIRQRLFVAPCRRSRPALGPPSDRTRGQSCPVEIRKVAPGGKRSAAATGYGSHVLEAEAAGCDQHVSPIGATEVDVDQPVTRSPSAPATLDGSVVDQESPTWLTKSMPVEQPAARLTRRPARREPVHITVPGFLLPLAGAGEAPPHAMQTAASARATSSFAAGTQALRTWRPTQRPWAGRARLPGSGCRRKPNRGLVAASMTRTAD
jgi:hypothetical protein